MAAIWAWTNSRPSPTTRGFRSTNSARPTPSCSARGTIPTSRRPNHARSEVEEVLAQSGSHAAGRRLRTLPAVDRGGHPVRRPPEERADDGPADRGAHARRAGPRDRRADQRTQSGLSRHTAIPITSRPWTPGTAWNCARSSGRCATCSTGASGRHGCPRPPSMCWRSSPTSKDSRVARSMTGAVGRAARLLTQLVRRRLAAHRTAGEETAHGTLLHHRSIPGTVRPLRPARTPAEPGCGLADHAVVIRCVASAGRRIDPLPRRPRTSLGPDPSGACGPDGWR